MIRFEESPFDGYGPRTKHNAEGADVTIAIAIDFSTAGEKLTRNMSIGKYLAVDARISAAEAAEKIVEFMLRKGAATMNVAGNSLHTWNRSKHLSGQPEINQYFFDVISKVHQQHPIESLRSGGQTGADWAALVAAEKLGIPGLGHFPKGYRQRNEKGVDFTQSKTDLQKTLAADVSALLSSANHQEGPPHGQFP